ncbi:MAG: hypothetical protein ACJ759_11365, partial [Thermoanaerobaculia bacterium]
KNADNGVLDVDVNRHTDSDTKAQDHDSTVGTRTGTGTTGTTTGAYGTNDTNNTNTGMNADNDNLPDTASGMPLLGLIGLLSLAGAVTLKATR